MDVTSTGNRGNSGAALKYARNSSSSTSEKYDGGRNLDAAPGSLSVRNLRALTRYRTSLAREYGLEAERLNSQLKEQAKMPESTRIFVENWDAEVISALNSSDHVQGFPDQIESVALDLQKFEAEAVCRSGRGNANYYDAFLCKMHLSRLKALRSQIKELSRQIHRATSPLNRVLDNLLAIKGVNLPIAETIIAETGGGAEPFPTPEYLAYLVGTYGRGVQSKSQKRSASTVQSQYWLSDALQTAAALRVEASRLTSSERESVDQEAEGNRADGLTTAGLSVITAVWHALSRTAVVSRANYGHDSPTLTACEMETLRFLVSDLTLQEIAMQRQVSANTVKTQVKAVYSKMGVNSRRMAVRKAYNLDLL